MERIKKSHVILVSVVASTLVLLLFLVPRVFAASCFPDTGGHWAESFICWLKDNGIVSGYGDGTYRPDNFVKRGEMAVYIKKGYELAKANDDNTDTLESLPCASNEIAKWNGSNWVCANDDNTLMGLSCTDNQVAKWNMSTSSWTCSDVGDYVVSTYVTFTSGVGDNLNSIPCNAGDVLVGGGCACNAPRNLEASIPNTTMGTPTYWMCRCSNSTQITAYSVCLDVSYP